MQNTAKAASPPIMVNISSSQLDIGHPQCPQRPLGKLDLFHRADGGEDGVVLNCRGPAQDAAMGTTFPDKAFSLQIGGT